MPTLLRPTVLSDQFDETAGAEIGGVEDVAVADDFDEHLVVLGTDGEDGDAALFELVHEKGLGHLGRAGGDEDAVEGGGLFPTEGAVGVVEVDVAAAEVHEAFPGGVEQGFDALDGVDFGGELGEDGGLVTASGADLEHAVFGVQIEPGGHEGDDVGLADGLAVTDGGGAVAVGAGAVFAREE